MKHMAKSEAMETCTPAVDTATENKRHKRKTSILHTLNAIKFTPNIILCVKRMHLSIIQTIFYLITT